MRWATPPQCLDRKYRLADLAPKRGLVSPQQLKGAFIGIGKTQEAQSAYEKIGKQMGSKAMLTPQVWVPIIELRISVDQRTNSLIVAGSRNDLDIIEAIISRLEDADVQAEPLEAQMSRRSNPSSTAAISTSSKTKLAWAGRRSTPWRNSN